MYRTSAKKGVHAGRDKTSISDKEKRKSREGYNQDTGVKNTKTLNEGGEVTSENLQRELCQKGCTEKKEKTATAPRW